MIAFKNCLFYLKLKIIINYKYGTIYRQAFQTPEIDYCPMLKGTIENPITSLFMGVVKDSLPEKVLKGCPMEGDYNMMMKIDDNKWIATSIFPTGFYKVEVKYKITNQRKKLFDINIEVEVVSPIKTSF